MLKRLRLHGLLKKIGKRLRCEGLIYVDTEGQTYQNVEKGSEYSLT